MSHVPTHPSFDALLHPFETQGELGAGNRPEGGLYGEHVAGQSVGPRHAGHEQRHITDYHDPILPFGEVADGLSDDPQASSHMPEQSTDGAKPVSGGNSEHTPTQAYTVSIEELEAMAASRRIMQPSAHAGDTVTAVSDAQTHPVPVTDEDKLALWAKLRGLGQTPASIAYRNTKVREGREAWRAPGGVHGHAVRVSRLGAVLTRHRAVRDT